LGNCIAKMLRAEIHFTNTRTGESVAVQLDLWDASFPETCRNFVFSCNSHLLDDDARKKHQDAITSPSATVRAALPPPLLNSSVAHIDARTVEFGTSATASMNGGFFPDEKEVAGGGGKNRRRGGADYTAGSLIMSNVGPNTNASRFILLLAEAPELRATHVCFGHTVVSTNIEQLRDFFSAVKVKVHPRTQVPLQKVVVSKCGVRRGLAAGTEGPRRLAGVVRTRDDEDNADDRGREKDLGAGDSGERALKKRRAEISIVDADGERRVVTTAIEPAQGQRFDFFSAQEAAFHNDLLDIKDSQLRKHHNRMNKTNKYAAHVLKKQGKLKPRRY
jgi:cyclophilin family peptidyl-prolyl cis-trans isomerase